MGKADYKKVSGGRAVSIKMDLNAFRFLSNNRKRKKRMKRKLIRYNRRKMRGDTNVKI